jgi:hypothetical protein
MGPIPRVLRDMPMTGTIRMMLTAFCLGMATPVMAGEPSPWLGSGDQTPFQLDPVTMVAVTTAGDPLQTGSLSFVPCLPESCANTGIPASNATATGSDPQK